MTVPTLLTTTEVARIFGVKPATVARWHRTGVLRGVKVGRDIRFAPEVVDKRIGAKS